MDGGAADNDAFLQQLEKQLEVIKTTQPDHDSLYNLFSIVSSILIEYRESGGQPGWVRKVLTPHGSFAFEDPKDADEVEKFADMYGDKILAALGLMPEGQRGGAPPAAAAGAGQTDAKDKAMAALASIGEFIDPRSVSLDGAVEFVLEYLDSANEKMEDMSRQIGIVALQNKVHEIPLQFIGLPPIPTRLLIIIVQGIFEIMRLISLFGFPGAGLFRIVGSLFGGLIELFKGDWKSALFTFMGLAGNGMMTMGLFGKVVVKVLSFMAPSMRDKLVLTGFQSVKSWVLGVMLFVFQTVAPLAIKQMVDQNIGKFGEMLADVQKKIDEVNGQITTTEEFECFTIEWLNLTDPAKTPDYDSLIKLQDLFMQPSFYCNNDVRTFVDQMKFIPPARIILELLGLPTTDRAYSDVCWNLPPNVIQGGLDIAILHSLKPVIRPRAPFTPATKLPEGQEGPLEQYNAQMATEYAAKYGNCPGFDMGQLRVAAAKAQEKLGRVFSLGVPGETDAALTSLAGNIRKGSTEAVGIAAEGASAAGKKAKESAQGIIGQIKDMKTPQLGIGAKQPTMAMMPPGSIAIIQQRGQQQPQPQSQGLNPIPRAIQSMTSGLIPQGVDLQISARRSQ